MSRSMSMSLLYDEDDDNEAGNAMMAAIEVCFFEFFF